MPFSSKTKENAQKSPKIRRNRGKTTETNQNRWKPPQNHRSTRYVCLELKSKAANPKSTNLKTQKSQTEKLKTSKTENPKNPKTENSKKSENPKIKKSRNEKLKISKTENSKTEIPNAELLKKTVPKTQKLISRPTSLLLPAARRVISHVNSQPPNPLNLLWTLPGFRGTRKPALDNAQLKIQF